MAQAIGSALYEEVLLDDDGRVTNPAFRQYHLPQFADVPRHRGALRRHRRRSGPAGRQVDEREPLQPGRPGAGNAIATPSAPAPTSSPFSRDRLWRLASEAAASPRRVDRRLTDRHAGPGRNEKGAADGGSSWATTSTAKPRTASCGSTATPPRHEIRDVSVSTCLRGDFARRTSSGDQLSAAHRHPEADGRTPSRKEKGHRLHRGVRLTLARHFVDDVAPSRGAHRIEIEEYAWQRSRWSTERSTTTPGCARARRCAPRRFTVDADGTRPRRRGGRRAEGSCDPQVHWQPEFFGFLKDEYTILEPDPRSGDGDFACRAMAVRHHGRGLERCLRREGADTSRVRNRPLARPPADAVRDRQGDPRGATPCIAEVRLVRAQQAPLPLRPRPLRLDNDNEVSTPTTGLRTHPGVRQRDDAPDAGPAWRQYTGLVDRRCSSTPHTDLRPDAPSSTGGSSRRRRRARAGSWPNGPDAQERRAPFGRAAPSPCGRSLTTNRR